MGAFRGNWIRPALLGALFFAPFPATADPVVPTSCDIQYSCPLKPTSLPNHDICEDAPLQLAHGPRLDAPHATVQMLSSCAHELQNCASEMLGASNVRIVHDQGETFAELSGELARRISATAVRAHQEGATLDEIRISSDPQLMRLAMALGYRSLAASYEISAVGHESLTTLRAI